VENKAVTPNAQYEEFIRPGSEVSAAHDEHDADTSAHMHHHSYGHMKDDLQKRLRRIEGQVRGIQKMVESDRYCVDILVQIAAIQSAMKQVGFAILDSHTRGCVRDAIASDTGGEAKIDELMDVIRQFTKA
jgi:CsoR family transcriptional regulator, copper-sensing transcriptional repressor